MVELAALDGSRQRLDVVVVRPLSDDLGDFCGESYVGAFTEVAWIEETKAVVHGTGGCCARTRSSRRPNCSGSRPL